MLEYIMLGLLVVLIAIVIYQLRIDTYTRQQLFNIQMEMAAAQQAMTKELSWPELKKILDEIVKFTCINYITVNGLRNMTDAKISLLWTAVLSDVSTSVESSISEELRRQILKNVSLMYLTKYIKDSVQLQIVNDLEKNRNNVVNQKLEYYQTGKVPTRQKTNDDK